MWNLIKMDYYRLFTNKAVNIGAVIAAALCAGYMLLSLGILELLKFSHSVDPSSTSGVGLFLPQVAWLDGADFAAIVFSATSVFALFVGCMITANFIGYEQSSGFTKNYAGQLPNRGYMAISKFVVTSTTQVMVIAIYTAVASLLAGLLFSRYITGYDILTLIGALALRIMLYLAINAVIIFICTLTKSHAVAMVVGCIFGIGVTQFGYMIAGMVLGMLNLNIPLSDFMPDGVDSQLSIGNVGEIAIKAIIVAVVFIAVFVSANYAILSKRDVR